MFGFPLLALRVLFAIGVTLLDVLTDLLRDLLMDPLLDPDLLRDLLPLLIDRAFLVRGSTLLPRPLLFRELFSDVALLIRVTLSVLRDR